MKKERKAALWAGISFLTAMVASLAGGGILESIITSMGSIPATDSSMLLNAGVALEILNALCVIIIAAMLFPSIQHHDSTAAIGYVSIRTIEALVCTASAAIPLLLNDPGIEAPVYRVLLHARTIQMNLLVPLFFCASAAILYYTSLFSRLIPKFLCIWGLAAVVMVIICNAFDMHVALKFALVLPIIVNEITLGIWLIVKGFGSKIELQPD